jgi:hypothetical protein
MPQSGGSEGGVVREAAPSGVANSVASAARAAIGSVHWQSGSQQRAAVHPLVLTIWQWTSGARGRQDGRRAVPSGATHA